MNKVRFQLESAGYCLANRSHALRKGKSETIRFYATYVHIEHPVHGHILFDTGYTRRFYDLTKKLPFTLYAKSTPVFVEEEQEAKSALMRKGVDPREIKFIIVSHFHADHIGGLRDFPNAQFICSQVAYQDIKDRKGWAAMKRGFIPDLMPEDFFSRARLLDFNSTTNEIDGLGKAIDLFEDQSILICQMDGHAKGQIGAYLNSETKTLLISDAAWVEENYKELHLPSPIVRLIFDSWGDFKKTLLRVHDFHKAHPEILIIPCHCEQTLRKLKD